MKPRGGLNREEVLNLNSQPVIGKAHQPFDDGGPNGSIYGQSLASGVLCAVSDQVKGGPMTNAGGWLSRREMAESSWPKGWLEKPSQIVI